MTLQEKLDCSTVIEERRMSRKDLGLLTKKQRKTSLIIFLLMSLYTIYTKIILKYEGFDWPIFFLVLNIITLFFIKITSNSVFQLNHFTLSKVIIFINKACKIGVFIFSFIAYLELFNELYKTLYDCTFGEYLLQILMHEKTVESLFEVSLNNTIKIISFFVSVVLFVPTFLYFIFSTLKSFSFIIVYLLFAIVLLIPLLNISIYLNFLFDNNKIFYYYRGVEDSEDVIKETRTIGKKGIFFGKIMTKFLFTIPHIIFVVIAYSYFINFIMNLWINK